MSRIVRILALAALAGSAIHAQPPRQLLDSAGREHRYKTEQELESLAVIDRRVMIPMRDGTRLMTDIYRPKNATGKVPAIFVRTPYDFNFWDVRNARARRHDQRPDGDQTRLRVRRAE